MNMAEVTLKPNWGDFEFTPVVLCDEISGGKVFEGKISDKKKKKKKKKSNNGKKRKSDRNCDLSCDGDKKLPICSHGGFPNHTQNGSSFGVQEFNGFSKIRNQGSDEVICNGCLGDILGSRPSAVLQCIKVEFHDSNGSVCGNTKNGNGRACVQTGRENRYLGCHWQNRNWVKEPSYRYGVKLVHPLENSSLPEDLWGSQPSTVLQCSKVELQGSDDICEVTKNGNATACALNGKGNRCSGWNWQNRPQNARKAQRNWVKEPSSRFGAEHVHALENKSVGAASRQLADGVSSNSSLPEDLRGSQPTTVLQCSKVEVQDSNVSVCKDTKNGNSTSCTVNGNENRYSGWNWQNRPQNARYEQKHWGKEPSYGYGAKHVRTLENDSVWAASRQLADKVSSNSSLPEDLWGSQPATVLQCSKVEVQDSNVSVCKDTKNGNSISCTVNGKENRYSGWNWQNRPQNARDEQRHWGKEPSYGYGAEHVHTLENDSVWAGSQHRLIGGLYRYFSQPSCKLRKDGTLEASNMKWRHVNTKLFRPMEGICSAGTCNASILNKPVLSKGMDNSPPETSSIPFSSSATFTDTKCTSSISSPQVISASNDHPKLHKSAAETGQRIESKGYEANDGRPKDTVELLIGSQRAVETLSMSYRMQLASEIGQLTMGYPLAEFERFIHCAAPVIGSSYLQKRCPVCLDDHLSHSFICQHRISNLPLSTVWSWFEKPGNYGLDVKADDAKNLSGPKSFHAYFFPSLSAVQLFQPHNRDSKTLYSRHFSEAAVLGDRSGLFSLDCLPDSELVFEFFESEQPHQRKPFYNKILELIGVGTSNHHTFGDPSKLGCLNLRDLHPASWFSVAWYPIYRIPEGKFHASFLTYHSLGYFVQRPVSTDASNIYTSHIFFPVLGLQSYNAQGECWFESNAPCGYSSKEPTSSNNAEILKKRLRTLEDNALHFARGLVCKDGVMVSNRHLDYEFFVSRKPHYK